MGYGTVRSDEAWSAILWGWGTVVDSTRFHVHNSKNRRMRLKFGSKGFCDALNSNLMLKKVCKWPKIIFSIFFKILILIFEVSVIHAWNSLSRSFLMLLRHTWCLKYSKNDLYLLIFEKTSSLHFNFKCNLIEIARSQNFLDVLAYTYKYNKGPI